MGGKVARTGATIELQELRRKIYQAAKSDKHKRFWGLYCHVVKEEVLTQAYKEAKANKGASGIDNMTFENIEQYGKEKFIAEISRELTEGTYRPQKNRIQKYPRKMEKQENLEYPQSKTE